MENTTAAIIKRKVRASLLDLGIKLTLVDKEVGYELRCASPCAFDIDYTRSLGEAAVTFLNQGGTNAMMSLQNGDPVAMPYDEIMDGDTGRTGVRMVNIYSYTYQSARKFMVRLEEQDLKDPERLSGLAAQTNLDPQAFAQRFGYLVENTAFTDSIYAIILEELGMIGGIILMLLFLLLLSRAFRIAKKAPDKLGQLLAGGIGFWLAFQAFLHMAANVALVPVTGVPLTFFTYGGSSLVVSLVGMGILLNVSRHVES